MDVSLAAICDAANTDSQGKLNLLGVFDQINVVNFPAKHPQCCVVFRVVFQKGQSTEQNFVIKFLNKDGESFLPSIKATSSSKCIKFQDKSVLNLIINVKNIKLTRADNFQVELHVNDELLKGVDLRIRQSVPTDR